MNANSLSDAAVRELRRIPELVRREVEYRMRQAGLDTNSSTRQVRLAKTTSSNHPYPSGPATQYEVQLGRPDFDDTVVGDPGAVTWEAYEPGADYVRVARSVEPVELAEGTLVTVKLFHEKWYIIGALEGAAVPKIRFKVTTKMVDRVATATVDHIVGTALHPGTLEPLELGDEVDVHDPQNLWSQVEPGALGWAFWREHPYGPDSEDPLNVPRWEVEECSLPVDEVRGYLVDCMQKCDQTASVTLLDPEVASTAARPKEVGSQCNSDNGPQNQSIRSGYANADLPPGITWGSGTAVVTAQNRHKLDGMKGSSVVLRRVTDRWYSEPDNVASPLAKSDTVAVWEIVLVERRKARWLKGTWSQSGTHQIDSYWDGDDPEDCGTVDVTALGATPCPLDGEAFIACYDPEADTYYLVATVSAWLGPPETMQVVGQLSQSSGGIISWDADGAACTVDLAYQVQQIQAFPCGGDAAEETAPLPTQQVALGTCIETQGFNLYLNRSMVCVLGVGTAAPCVVEGDPCDEPPDCNYGGSGA